MSKIDFSRCYLDTNGAPWDSSEVRDLYTLYVSCGHSDADFDRISADFFIYRIPSRLQCRGFLADLRGMAYGSSNHANGGIMSVSHIADLLGIAFDDADYFMTGCLAWRLTERQGGGYVI